MTAASSSVGFERDQSAWKPVLIVGLLFMGVAFYLSLVGILGRFHEVDLVEDLATRGQAVLTLTIVGAGLILGQKLGALFRV